ncbi:MAG TPA: DEAD/DEAH box helicase [Blastocatellia bacterium]|nr:DEAD/DEAH box helicase [Blastocatellia bacterium]
MKFSSFNELGLSASLVGALGKLGITQPTDVQSSVIPAALAGRDIAASAETGSGKTAAFLLPIIERLMQSRSARALVLAPTRELVLQIEANARSYSRVARLRTLALVGGESMTMQIKALKNGADIIIATPGRLNDLVTRRLLTLNAMEIFVLDEADRMLDMGFFPQVRQLVDHLPKVRQTLLLSATFSAAVEKLARELLVNPLRVIADRTNTTVAALTQKAYPVLSSHKESLLVALLKHHHQGSFLVFTRTKRVADRIAQTLANNNCKVATLHSDRSQSQRNQALSSFRDGKVRVLVATDVAARGIDVDHVSHVINYEVPASVEDYVHRVGRTARAGRSGAALTLVSPSEEPALDSIERATGVNMERSLLQGFSDGRTEQQIKFAANLPRTVSSFSRSFGPRRASR